MASATGCDSFLDVNTNPNNPTTATADAILAQALTATANNYSVVFNPYSSFVAGQVGKSGTVNGYNEERTYNYNSSYSQGLFNATYDNLYDYNLVEKLGKANGLPNQASIAEIMKVYNFQLLVDQYGDIPYSDALQGGANVTPKYDKADAIYKDLVVKLDQAVAEIKANTGNANVRAVGGEDVVFGGNMTNWIRFANSLKLRILMRQSSTGATALDTYVRTEMAKLETFAAANGGFITSDVQVQPGYSQSASKQNPFWDRYRADASGSSALERYYTIGTKYYMAQYEGNHDPRGTRIWNTIGGHLVGVILGTSATGPDMPLGTNASRYRDFGGVFKGFDAAVPLMLRADDLFTQAEAKSRGYLTGGDAAAKTDFNNGITASFTFFYTPSPANRGNATRDSSAFVPAKVAKYLAANTTNPLVNWESGTISKQEKIIYQKYLAVNAVASTEAWADYRRTGFPKIPASIQSSITSRADKLPTRLLYPLTEVSTNATNLAAVGAITNTTKIFWDVVD